MSSSADAAADDNVGKDWKALATSREQELADLREEFHEFETTSKEIEKELEEELEETSGTLERAREKISQLEQRNASLQSDRDNLNIRVGHLERRVKELEESEQIGTKHRRQMEMDNDRYERRRRVDESTIERLREDLEKAEEDLILTRDELDTVRRDAMEESQRQRDELRDTRDEIEALKRKLTTKGDDTVRSPSRRASRTRSRSSSSNAVRKAAAASFAHRTPRERRRSQRLSNKSNGIA